MSKLSVTPVNGVYNTEKRGVAFLRGPTELAEINGARYFDSIADKPVGKRLRQKMGLWIGFKPDTQGKFHRFKGKKPKYRECFVFIDIEEQCRLYGHTCHPKLEEERFELVLLITYVTKKEDLTNDAELDRVLKWTNAAATQTAIRVAFPDKRAKSEDKK
jgi:hypothetical protein